MSVISEIKCSKCDRMYSGLRSKCPYCGVRRISRGKYSEDGENSSGKILIAILIMAVFVVATGVLLFTTEVEEIPDETVLSEDEMDPDDGLVSLESEITVPEPIELEEEEEEEPEEPLEALTLRSISVLYRGNQLIQGSEGREFSFRVGESLSLTARVEPLGIEADIIWASSDRAIFEVTPTDTSGTEAVVRAIGRGTGRLTVTVGELTETVIVRVQS